MDANDNIFVADSDSHTIRKILSDGTVSTLAGLSLSVGSSDGLGALARFSFPTSLCVSSDGDLFVTDTSNHTIRKVTMAGEVTTFVGLAGQSGNVNGSPLVAKFNRPGGVCITASGDILVSDSSNQSIRRISSSGNVTTLSEGAGFSGPLGITVTANGEIYIIDSGNFVIRKIGQDSMVTTLAGRPNWGDADGNTQLARFNFGSAGSAIAVGLNNRFYIADNANLVIRQIQDLEVTTVAGMKGVSGNVNGPATSAKFYNIYGIACDSLGNVYVSQSNSHLIRKLSADNQVTTVAGSFNTAGATDGTGASALFRSPIGLAVDASNRVLIADRENHAIRRMTPEGVVTTIAGTRGTSGTTNGPALSAQFNAPQSVAVDSSGLIYVADTNNHCIRRINLDGNVETFAGLAGTSGYVDGSASAARFNNPAGVATDTSGNVYVAEGYARIRKITPSGLTTTIGGSSFGYNEGIGSSALFFSPSRLAVDSQGLVYVPDTGSHRMVVGGVMPVQLTESATGSPILGSSTSLVYDEQLIGAPNQIRQVVLRNNGTADLNVTLTMSGTDANSFMVNSPSSFSVPPGGSSTLTITLTSSGASGLRTANLRIGSNDLIQSSLDVALSADAYSNTLDVDNDGMNDWGEYKLNALGFDWQVPNTALVSTYYDNAAAASLYNQTQYNANRTAGQNDVINSPNTYSLYTLSQIQNLNVGTPLLQRNPSTGEFTLTIGVDKSTNLSTWTPIPMTVPQTIINSQGKMEFRFTTPDNAAFFRLQTQPAP